jgi:hypothetical protein
LRKNSQIILLIASDEQVISTKRSLELGIKSIADSSNTEFIRVKRLVELINYHNDYAKSILKVTKYRFISNLRGVK